MAAPPPLELHGVRKGWTGRPVLGGIDVALAAGEIVALLGENGAGKTTLLRVLAGTVRPDAGRVVRAHGATVGLVGGARGLYAILSARENLRFYGALDGLVGAELRARIDAVAATFDLDGVLDRRVVELSSGIRQRLALARGALADPAVLLLDEPSRALDAAHARALHAYVRDRATAGRAVVLATHDLDEALALGDRIVVLGGGVLRAIARPATGGLDPETIFGASASASARA